TTRLVLQRLIYKADTFTQNPLQSRIDEFSSRLNQQTISQDGNIADAGDDQESFERLVLAYHDARGNSKQRSLLADKLAVAAKREGKSKDELAKDQSDAAAAALASWIISQPDPSDLSLLQHLIKRVNSLPNHPKYRIALAIRRWIEGQGSAL